MKTIECNNDADIHAIVEKHNLDRRRKYVRYGDELVASEWATSPCSGCDGNGCNECVYTGKRRMPYPFPASLYQKKRP